MNIFHGREGARPGAILDLWQLCVALARFALLLLCVDGRA